jgi:hypothetical protein
VLAGSTYSIAALFLPPSLTLTRLFAPQRSRQRRASACADSDHRASSLPNRSSSMHNTPVCEGGLEPVIVFR